MVIDTMAFTGIVDRNYHINNSTPGFSLLAPSYSLSKLETTFPSLGGNNISLATVCRETRMYLSFWRFLDLETKSNMFFPFPHFIRSPFNLACVFDRCTKIQKESEQSPFT